MRNIQPFIEKDLKEKFIFLSGPRQVGKTYLAKTIVEKLGGKYYNWDAVEDRQQILQQGFINDGIVVLDELHKYDRWKNLIKGVFDKHCERLKAIITGSARLDTYKKGGDSLLGRYFSFHLHPLTIGELVNPENINRLDALLNSANQPLPSKEIFEQLYRFGGFPEPFYAANEEAHNRWSMQRRELLVKEDIRDLTNINLLSLIEQLMLILPSRVGSILSVNSLKEDLQVAYNTVQLWLNAFEKLYITFTLKPFTKKVHRSVNKEKKVYLWDWSQVKDEGARFENFVASHLWKAVSIWRDLGFGNYELWFLRDRERREVDFCITLDRTPCLLVEAKLSDETPDQNLSYFSNRFNIPAVQVIKNVGAERSLGLVRTVAAAGWLSLLP